MTIPHGTNDIQLICTVDGVLCNHFRLREFHNAEGLAMVNETLLKSLEATRRDLWFLMGEECAIRITCGVRTEADNECLAARLGWTDSGGSVSRNSKHLPRYGGIAADFYAHTAETRQPVPQKDLGRIARRYFDFVKDDYGDEHVHADNRDGGKVK